VLDWVDTHSAAVAAASTIILVAVTAYYAWTSRALVRETHITLQAAARSTLQQRLDRISEICIHNPTLYPGLDDDGATGEEFDGRFFVANMFLGVLEEAHLQYRMERSMTADDWGAWVATADTFLTKVFIQRYWQRVAPTYEPGFQQFVNERLAAAQSR
jgi:hypothetical protein